MDYPKISIDKVDQEIHRFEQTPMAEPVVQQQQQKAAITGTTSPVAPPPQVTAPAQTASAPQAPPPDLPGMVSNVTSNYADMQKQMPEPQLPIHEGLKLLGGLGLLAAGGLGLNKLLSEKEPAPVKPGSIESRKIGAGPQMNTNTSEPRMVGDLFPANVSTKPIAGPAPEVPTVPLNTPVGKAPKEMSMIEQGLANKEINAVAEGRKKAVPPPSKSVIDISGLTKEEAGMKKYLTSFYGGGIPGEQAYEKTIEILGGRPSYEPGKGGGLTPEQNKAIKDWRKENVQGPKVNLTKDMKSAIKGGAGLAILAAIPGFAEAKNIREGVGNVAEGMLPIGMTPSPIAPGTLTEKQLNAFKEAQKLGSPYRSVPPR